MTFRELAFEINNLPEKQKDQEVLVDVNGDMLVVMEEGLFQFNRDIDEYMASDTEEKTGVCLTL